MPSIRAFIALPLRPSRKITAMLTDLDALKNGVRAVAPESLHLTLKFLGDIDLANIAPLTDALKAALRNIEPFDIRLAGLGVFPHEQRPTVVWIGLDPAGEIAAVASAIEEHVGPLGFPRETRPFAAHVTIARIKNRPPDRLFDILNKRRTEEFGVEPFTEVAIYQSDLGPSGPKYTRLATVPLGD